MSNLPATIPTPSLITAEEVELAANALAMVQQVQITDQQTCADANELMVEISQLKKLINERREEVKAPYLAVGKAIDAATQPTIKGLDVCVTMIKTKLAEYTLAVERERILAEAEQRRREVEEAEKAKVSGHVTPALVTSVVIPDAAPIKTRALPPEVEITDIHQIPRYLMEPNLPAIKTELLKNPQSVPGARLIQRRTIVAK